MRVQNHDCNHTHNFLIKNNKRNPKKFQHHHLNLVMDFIDQMDPPKPPTTTPKSRKYSPHFGMIMPCYDKFNPTITINRTCPMKLKN